MFDLFDIYEVAGDGTRARVGTSPYIGEAGVYAGTVFMVAVRDAASKVTAVVVEGSDTKQVFHHYVVEEQRAVIARFRDCPRRQQRVLRSFK